MTNPTSNFGWQMPTSTDLVTDLPADFEVFGQAVDTSLADLKGGTTGQVLKKNSNTDMDFVWGADSAGMTNPMTTTGDTIYSSSGSTPARLGIGTTGQVLTVSGGLPAWATPASGSMTLLSTGTLTGSAVALTSISQSYKALRLVLQSYSLSNSDQAVLRLNNDSSTSYSQGGFYSGTTSGDYNQTGTIIKLNATNASSGQTNHSAVVDFPNYAQIDTVKLITLNSGYYNSTNTTWANFDSGTTYFSDSAITSIYMRADYGGAYTWDNGTYFLYGVN